MNSENRTDYQGEPSIEELLADPIIRLVMRRDGLTVVAVRQVFDEAARRLGRAEAGKRRAA